MAMVSSYEARRAGEKVEGKLIGFGAEKVRGMKTSSE